MGHHPTGMENLFFESSASSFPSCMLFHGRGPNPFVVFYCVPLYPNPSWISSRGRREIYNHFIDDFPIRTSIFPGGILRPAMFDYRMVLYLKPPLSTIGNGLCLSPWHLAKQIQTSDDARLAVVTLWNPSWPKNIHHLHRLESIYIHVYMYNYICVCIDIFC